MNSQVLSAGFSDRARALLSLTKPRVVSLIVFTAVIGMFLATLRIYLAYSDRVARQTFRYSIVYLAALFAALLVDHYLPL